MKKALIVSLVAAAAAVGSTAFAQDFAQPIRREQIVSRPPDAPRLIREGALNRGIRKGNPAQLINPFAPRHYGSGAEFVEHRLDDPFLRPRDPSHEPPIALRLLAFEF